VHRLASELLTVGVAMVVMPTMILLFGATVLPTPLSPGDLDEGTGGTGQSECFRATVAALQGSGIAGYGRLCVGDVGVRPIARLIGLTPGVQYSAWLGYTTQVFADPPTSSGTIIWRGGAPDGLPRFLGEETAPRTGELEFRGDFADLHFAGRAQVTLTVLRAGGPSGAHAQIVFEVHENPVLRVRSIVGTP
jgi:hypothetical protein